MNTSTVPLGRPAALASIAFVVAVALSPAAGRADPQTRLYHRFETRPTDQWAEVTLSLQPGAWRVGAEDGPVASAEQLRAALEAARGLAIGARCQGISDGSTHYPCTVELAQPAWLPATHAAKAADIQGWLANTGDTLVHFEKGSVAAASLGGAAVGLTSHAGAASQQDLVSLLAPARFMAPSVED